MLSKSSNTRSFQEVLADLRTTRIGTGLPSPAEILHGRNLTTRAQAEINIKAIRSVLQERQLKMTLDHNMSRRAKKARPLVVGERCHVLGPGNKWIDAFITGITDSGRSYETQVEVTDPDLLIPIKQTRVTTRHSDLREPQPSSSDSQPASSQPVSETTTSESSVSLPSSPSGSSSTESTSTSGTNSSSSETSSESSSQPSLNASSPETSSSASTSRSTSPKLLEMERSFNSLLVGTRNHQGHPVTRSQMDNLRNQQQRIAVLKQVASQPQNQPWPVSVPPVANMPLPLYPRRRPSDKGSKKQVQAENANAPHKSSDSETDRLQDIQEEPRRRIGPSCVKELAKFFTPTSDEEENSQVNNRTRCKKLFKPKKEEESEK